MIEISNMVEILKYNTEYDKISESLQDYEFIEFNRKNNPHNLVIMQTYILMKKTLLVFSRNLKTTLFMFLSPFIICLFLVQLQNFLEFYSLKYVELNPSQTNLNDNLIPKCNKPINCTTILGIVIDKSRNEYNRQESYNILSFVANQNNLKMNEDIILSTISNYSEFSSYIEVNKNKTFYGIVFCYDNLDVNSNMQKINLSIPCVPEIKKENEIYRFYTIVYNITLSPNDFLAPLQNRAKDKYLMKLQMDIDNGYLIEMNKIFKIYKNNPKLNVSFADFPQTENRFMENASVVNNLGGPYFLFIPMTFFIMVLIEIVREKELKLRKSLIVIGLSNTAFWLSWIFTSIFFSGVLSITFLIFVTYVLKWELFLNTPFPLMFLLFFLFILDMQLMALFFSTIISTIKGAYTWGFAIILTSGVLQGFFSNPYLYQILYSTDIFFLVRCFKWFLYSFSPYNFNKAYVDIATIAGTKFDPITLTNNPGRHYKYSDLFVRQEGSMRRLLFSYSIAPTIVNFCLLFVNGICYLISTIYFDTVIEDNRGKARSYLFPIYDFIDFWKNCFKRKKKDYSIIVEMGNVNSLFPENLNENNETNNNENEINEKEKNNKNDNETDRKSTENSDNIILIDNPGDETVKNEKNEIIKNEKDINSGIFIGLRVCGINKTYKLRNEKELNALKETYLQVPKGELLTLLGHNGAGKTTLINVLCGNIKPTSGYAKINNINITEEKNSNLKLKRDLIGLCPQHDILWDELTPKEHIELYSIIRGYQSKDINLISELKMKEVNLEKVINHQVKTFSGGMKRRISILLSTIGEPNVVFLDEPSTGLDPVNRRFIWSMIKNIKKKSIVILTTHSMNEAEFLSDKICIIKKGVMKCIGTSLELKKIYGNGYIISVVCFKNKDKECIQEINQLCHNVKLISSKAGFLFYSLNFGFENELNLFIKILNRKFEGKLKVLENLIKEIGIEQTSIEDVFLKITKDDNEEF